MCNANNHPPGCNCGWGQGYGAGGYSGGAYHALASVRRFSPTAIKQPMLASGFLWRGNRELNFRAYTIPNATCPVCGASVFFYQSPYGGRVFFDELGPPWPKHPCTDNYFCSGAAEGLIYQPVATPTYKPSWAEQGWKSLSSITVESGDDSVIFFKAFSYDPVTLHMFGLRRKYSVNFDSPLFCRRMTDGRWELSWIPSAQSYSQLDPQTAIAVPFYPRFMSGRVELWEKAIRGDIPAQNMVGMSLTLHLDTPSAREHKTFPQKCDWDAAKMWFESAAVTGYWPSINNLGVMYENGYGVEANPAMAFELYSKAAQEMSPISLKHLADCYEKGIGTESDLEMASYLRELAAIAEEDGGHDNE